MRSVRSTELTQTGLAEFLVPELLESQGSNLCTAPGSLRLCGGIRAILPARSRLHTFTPPLPPSWQCFLWLEESRNVPRSGRRGREARGFWNHRTAFLRRGSPSDGPVPIQQRERALLQRHSDRPREPLPKNVEAIQTKRCTDSCR